MLKIVTIVGARPQFVKAAVVSRVLKNTSNCSEVLIHTGQHYDVKMSDLFFQEMEIPKPDYQLSISGGTHAQMTGAMLIKIEEVISQEKPDVVLVYGDTNSTLAGALSAAKLNIPVAHVEAGLRSYNMRMPEEVNRILTDNVSNLLFCPTQTAVDNLKQEGFGIAKSGSIRLTGDVMYDAVLHYQPLAEKRSKILTDLGIVPDEYVLCTLHRQENVDDDDKLGEIISALNALSKDSKIVFPVHPRTRQRIDKLGMELNCFAIEPVGYFDMLQLLKHSKSVMTDSGGLQKEAYFSRKPCLTMREETEWTELVAGGVNILCGSSRESIIECFKKLNSEFNCDFPKELYGDGAAGEKIVSCMVSGGQ
jgi:UDP-GlcNAc3NAcA epimerase